jgi:hypothetical protein
MLLYLFYRTLIIIFLLFSQFLIDLPLEKGIIIPWQVKQFPVSLEEVAITKEKDSAVIFNQQLEPLNIIFYGLLPVFLISFGNNPPNLLSILFLLLPINFLINLI